jgi:hypothetical protein
MELDHDTIIAMMTGESRHSHHSHEMRNGTARVAVPNGTSMPTVMPSSGMVPRSDAVMIAAELAATKRQLASALNQNATLRAALRKAVTMLQSAGAAPAGASWQPTARAPTSPAARGASTSASAQASATRPMPSAATSAADAVVEVTSDVAPPAASDWRMQFADRDVGGFGDADDVGGIDSELGLDG